MVDLLAQRFAVVRSVVEHKARHDIAARLDDRVEAVVDHVRLQADAVGCPPDLAETVWRAMIEWIIGFEESQLRGDERGQGPRPLAGEGIKLHPS